MRKLVTCVAVAIVALSGCRPRQPAADQGEGGPASPGPVAGQAWTVPDLGMEFVWIKQMGMWVGKYGNYAGEERVPLRNNMTSGPTIDGYKDSSIVACPVEQSGENAWGLFGVGGNVRECTLENNSLTRFAAWRGGAWHGHGGQDYLRCTSRLGLFASSFRNACGFRLVLSRPGPE